MKYLKLYKLFIKESSFVPSEEVNNLLDKIVDNGIDSITDIEKNRLDLFSSEDKEIIDIIDKMGDLTIEFKKINNEIRRCQDSGESDGFHLMKDWMELNKKMRELESRFKKWGIELGDPILYNLMNKIRPDAYKNID